MIIYLDTGLFIDYLAPRGHQASGLRSAARRGRALPQVFQDAEDLLTRISKDSTHQGYTSALTFYEAEEALFKRLSSDAKGVSKATALIVPVARSIVMQVDTATRYFGITVCDLTASTVQAQLRERELETKGIRAADSLHMMTAALLNADIVVSTDDAVLAIDQTIKNISGKAMRCLDSDQALAVI